MSHWQPNQGARKFKPVSGPRHFSPAHPPTRPPAQPDLLDADRAAFITALDGAAFELPEWEAEFTGSMFVRIERKLPFTDKMRVQIDRLMSKYGTRVKWVPQAVAVRKDPVRSETRVAYVPDDAQRLLSPGGGR